MLWPRNHPTDGGDAPQYADTAKFATEPVVDRSTMKLGTADGAMSHTGLLHATGSPSHATSLHVAHNYLTTDTSSSCIPN